MRMLLISLIIASMLGVGCKKKSAASVADSGGGGPASTEMSGGGGNAQSTGYGAVQRKAVTPNELNQLRLFIDTASGASGQMPKPADVLAAMQKEAPTIAAHIQDGTLVINPARSREEIWAYEAKALESRGWVVTSAGNEVMDAATLKSRLNR